MMRTTGLGLPMTVIGAVAFLVVLAPGAAVAQPPQPPFPECGDSPLSINPLFVSVGHSPQGLISVSVGGSGGCSWAVSTDEDWLETLETTVSEGGTVLVSVNDNLGVARSGTVSIGNESVTINQADGCVAGWSTGPLGFYAAGSQNARASGSPACTFDVSDDRDWITVSPSRVAGGGLVTVTAAENVDPWRRGTVTISNMNGSDDLRITQANGCSPAGGTTSLIFAKEGGSQPAGPGGSGNCPFGVSKDQDWISVSASSVAGSGTVMVTVLPNNGLERTGTVTFSHANGNATVKITQRNGCMPAGGTTSLTFGKEGGSQNARPGGSSACTFGVSDDRDWIRVGVSSVVGSRTVEVFVTENNGPERTGTVTFSHANGDATVTIRQRNGCSPAGGTTSLTFGKEGGTQNARPGGSSACTFGVSKDRDWISVSASSVAGSRWVSVTVEPNDGLERTGTVTFSHANGNATVKITQRNGCMPAGGTTSLTFGKAGGSPQNARPGGSSACTFGVSKDRDWISVSASSVAGSGTVMVTVLPNNGLERTGTVTFSHANGDATVKITQRNGCMPAGGTTSLTFGKAGGTQNARPGGSSACTFGVSDDRDWIRVGASSVAGSGTVEVFVTENNGPERTGTVTFSHANGDATVTIRQRNGCSPAGGTTSLTFGKAADSQNAGPGGSSACTFVVSDGPGLDQGGCVLGSRQRDGGGLCHGEQRS